MLENCERHFEQPSTSKAGSIEEPKADNVKKTKKSKKEKKKKSKRTFKEDPDLKDTLSSRICESITNKRIKCAIFNPFDGTPEKWLSEFEDAVRNGGLDVDDNGIKQVQYFLTGHGKKW